MPLTPRHKCTVYGDIINMIDDTPILSLNCRALVIEEEKIR